jgi:hypothetical protein
MTATAATDNRKQPGRPRETSLPYVTLDPHYVDHRRTQALVDALADHIELPESLVELIPVRLFCLAGRSAIDGCLGALSSRALRRIVAPEFNVDHEVLYAALTDPSDGFLVLDDDGALWVHDWGDHGGQAAQKRADWRQRKASIAERRRKDRERKREAREKAKEPGDCPTDTARTTTDTVRTSADIARTLSPAAEKPPVLSHPKNDEKQNETNDLQYSSGIPRELREIPPVKGKGEGEVKHTDNTAPTVPAKPVVQAAAQRGVVGLVSLDSRQDTDELTLAELERYLVERRVLSPGVGIGHRTRNVHRQSPVRVYELRVALGGVHRAVSSADGYIAGTIAKMRQEGAQPTPRAKAGSIPTQASKARPRTPQEVTAANKELWRSAMIQCGYPVDDERLALWSETEPTAEDIELMRSHQGNWESYDRSAASARENAAKAIEALLSGKAAAA